MIQANFRTGFFLGLLSLLFLTPNRVQAITFESIVVFGGSLSDSGNFFALYGIANKPPYDYDQLAGTLVPTGPYSTGGHHFSNGATWIEDLAKNLGLNRNANPAFQGSSPFANNYAVGGARSTAGARKFLILNVADIGEIPSIRLLDNLYNAGGLIMQGATNLSVGFNLWVDFLLSLLPPNVEIAKLDVFGTVHELVADSPAYGLVNVTDACITPNVPPFSCKNSDQFLFWDGIHPTRAVQAILAEVAADVLGQ